MFSTVNICATDSVANALMSEVFAMQCRALGDNCAIQTQHFAQKSTSALEVRNTFGKRIYRRYF